jgi:hypothetical protein
MKPVPHGGAAVAICKELESHVRQCHWSINEGGKRRRSYPVPRGGGEKKVAATPLVPYTIQPVRSLVPSPENTLTCCFNSLTSNDMGSSRQPNADRPIYFMMWQGWGRICFSLLQHLLNLTATIRKVCLPNTWSRTETLFRLRAYSTKANEPR